MNLLLACVSKLKGFLARTAREQWSSESRVGVEGSAGFARAAGRIADSKQELREGEARGSVTRKAIDELLESGARFGQTRCLCEHVRALEEKCFLLRVERCRLSRSFGSAAQIAALLEELGKLEPRPSLLGLDLEQRPVC